VARELALVLHDRLLAEHGGAPGLRDQRPLDSALARPRQRHAYGDPDVCALAASHAAGLVRNHPFVDGNRRTAFMAAYGLAAGEIDEDAFAAWLRHNTAA
jgi:death on curing protein